MPSLAEVSVLLNLVQVSVLINFVAFGLSGIAVIEEDAVSGGEDGVPGVSPVLKSLDVLESTIRVDVVEFSLSLGGIVEGNSVAVVPVEGNDGSPGLSPSIEFLDESEGTIVVYPVDFTLSGMLVVEDDSGASSQVDDLQEFPGASPVGVLVQETLKVSGSINVP